jgi:hypothetical protein
VTSKTPDGLEAGGRALWDAVLADAPDIDEPQRVQLLEACRSKDRLDQLDRLLRGEISTWARLVHHARDDVYDLRIDGALTQANATANQMKQLLAACRLPDVKTGKRPQARPARGVYKSGGGVTAIDKLRQAG